MKTLFDDGQDFVLRIVFDLLPYEFYTHVVKRVASLREHGNGPAPSLLQPRDLSEAEAEDLRAFYADEASIHSASAKDIQEDFQRLMDLVKKYQG